jgi:hypothetical protein
LRQYGSIAAIESAVNLAYCVNAAHSLTSSLRQRQPPDRRFTLGMNRSQRHRPAALPAALGPFAD